MDVVILNDSDGAFGYGHNGISIGDDTVGWDYYSQDSPSGGGGHHIHYDSYDKMMEEQEDRYDRSFELPCTEEQDENMLKAAEENLHNPYSANPLDPNRYHCGDLVNDILEAGEISHGEESFGNKPNDAFVQIYIENPIKIDRDEDCKY
jgi:hypothetical protein